MKFRRENFLECGRLAFAPVAQEVLELGIAKDIKKRKAAL
jgi:hypothetical protein